MVYGFDDLKVIHRQRRIEMRAEIDVKKLKDKMVEKNICTAYAMYKKTGVSRQTIDKILNLGYCRLDVAIKLANSLGIDIKELAKW